MDLKHKRLVDGALPGEEILGSVIARKKNYARVKIEKLLKTSPDRVEPPCIYYEKCGSCQLMHFSYPTQLIHKQKRVHDC